MNDETASLSNFAKDFLLFIQSYTLDSQISDRQFELTRALKSFDLLLEKTLLRLKDQKFALLFSGGLDSSILAFKLNQLNIKYQPILVAKPKEIDYRNAVEVAKILNIDLTILDFDLPALEGFLPDIIRTINTTEEKQINISLPFYLAAKYLKTHDIPIAVLGQGADELFCGYQRYVDNLRANPTTFKTYHLEDVKRSLQPNFDRDSAIFTSQNLGIYLPYLDQEIVKLTFSVPNEVLIPPGDEALVKKNFLRLYAKMVGMDDRIIQKKKVAVQFGSGSYRLIRKLALSKGFTKQFSKKYGYNDNTQLYLDDIAQNAKIKNFDLKIEK